MSAAEGLLTNRDDIPDPATTAVKQQQQHTHVYHHQVPP
jgi:hypothetical protein